jgi:pyruvate formate lyase activating enzyme
MDKKGVIFHIQRFSVHDGPGIRTTVFMKGCPLECRWCCNPESIRASLEIMFHSKKCIDCRKCFDVCPESAIIILEGDKRIDFYKCTYCMECVKVCSTKALECVGSYMRVSEVVKEVRKDFLFYQNSGGGVTISGGEPLLQWKFARDILQSCKEEGLHTALDTTGYASWKVIREVLKYVDLVLYDLKHTDNDLHLKGTGVSNNLISENLKKTASTVRTWLRFPVLPGYNDSIKNAEKVACLASKLGIEKVSLLVYHEWGKPKYEKLGRVYPFLFPGEIGDQRLENIKKIFDERGVKATLND